MADGLDIATSLLNAALDRYNAACTRLRTQYLPGTGLRIGHIPPEFTNRVVEELSRVASHETEIRYSKAILNWLRNFSESGTALSINRLPPEILTRVFEYVVNMHPCPAVRECSLQEPSRDTFPKDPVILSHVCSHWRQIVVNAAGLWSHIDIYPMQFREPRLLARLDTYAARSSQAPVELHIIEEHPGAPRHLRSARNVVHDNPSIASFLATMAPRMRSLKVYTKRGLSGAGFCRSVIVACLSRCTPGTLTHVSICVTGRDVDAGVDTQFQAGKLTGVTPEIAEVFWLPVKVLRLETIHLRWTSKAYHGLTELRLVEIGSISQAMLKSVLQSSPELRTLELHLKYHEFQFDDMPITPVRLDNLEILVLSAPWEQINIPILQLLAPGTKPLSLSFINPYLCDLKFTCKNELARFAARSNITRLSAHAFDEYAQLAEVLSLMPAVRVLSVDGISCHAIDEETALPPGMVFEALYVINSSEFGQFTWPCLERFVEKYCVQKLTLWQYDFRYTGLSERGKKMIPDNLYTICPVVNVVPNTDPNPIQEWF